MEDTTGSSASSNAPRRDNALLNQSLDDIIKKNRNTRRNEKREKKTGSSLSKDQKNNSNLRNNRNNSNKRNNNKMMDIAPINNNNNGIQKQRAPRRHNDFRDSLDSRRRGGNLIVRSNSGKAPGARSDRRPPSVGSSTPGIRQPWEKLPVAPIPSEPLKISIRNELADKPTRRSDMMVDSDSVVGRPAFSASSAPYEPRDSLASREEYRIGNRFSTQGMAIDYQLPSGASYDTRPTRRY